MEAAKVPTLATMHVETNCLLWEDPGQNSSAMQG